MARSSSAVILISLTLAACGGGSDGTSITPGNPNPTGVAITSGNAQPVAAASWRSANQSSEFAGLVGNSGVVANDPGNINKSGADSLAANIARVAVQSVPFGPIALPCAVSGSLTVSGDLADPLAQNLTAGDVINADADNCDDGLGEVLDGLLEMTIDAFTGQLLLASYDMTATMTATNLQATTASDVETLNGVVTVSLNTLQAPFVSASVSGPSMTTDTNAGSDTLTNFESTQTVDAGLQPAPYTLNSSGTLDSSELTDVVSYTTPVTFLGDDVDYPHTGELLVNGLNSSARLIALDNVNVRIEIDTNGDNVVDEVIDTTWAELDN